MKTKIAVGVVSAAVLLYVVFVGQRAWLMMVSGNVVGIVMGVALIVLPIIGAWAIVRELWFGVRAEHAAKRLEAEGGMPDDEVSVRPSGRIIREDGAAVFPKYRTQVQQSPDDWRAWFRLGLAYDAAGDRRRARSAIRQSLRLEAKDRPAS